MGMRGTGVATLVTVVARMGIDELGRMRGAGADEEAMRVDEPGKTVEADEGTAEPDKTVEANEAVNLPTGESIGHLCDIYQDRAIPMPYSP